MDLNEKYLREQKRRRQIFFGSLSAMDGTNCGGNGFFREKCLRNKLRCKNSAAVGNNVCFQRNAESNGCSTCRVSDTSAMRLTCRCFCTATLRDEAFPAH